MKRFFLVGCILLLATAEGHAQCVNVVKQATKTSKWCNYSIAPPIKTKPIKAKGTNVGRQTIFAGPLGHSGYCQKPLWGSEKIATVALSTKYLGANYKGIYPDPACGKCICILVRGWDPKTSTNPYKAACLAPKYVGLTFKARAIEQCSECEDDHIDMLADAPWSSNPDNKGANARLGKRIIDHDTAWTVGTFVSEWGFAPCSADCAKYFGPTTIKKAKTIGPKKPAYCK